MKYCWLIALFWVTAYLLPLGNRPLLAPDEFRYAQIPYEMVETGDWVVPHLLGMRYFEKPVGGYWLTALSFKLFGYNHFALRLPAALGAGLAAFMIAYMMHQVTRDDRIAALGALFFLASGLVLGVGTCAVLDLPFTGMVTLAAMDLYLAAAEPRWNRRKILLLFWAGGAIGFAFLIKGFLALVFPGLAMAGFLLWERRWKDIALLPWLPLLVAAVIVAPWAYAIALREPDFWRYFVVEEHLVRFGATAASKVQHPQPWWYYFPLLAGGIFPAAFPALGSLTIGRKQWSEILSRKMFRFAFCGFLLPLLFLSCSKGKLATYMIPCLPPLAVLAAAGTAAYFNTGRPRLFHWTMNVLGALLVLAGIGALVLWFRKPPFLQSFAAGGWAFPVTASVAILCGLLQLASSVLIWRKRLYLFCEAVAILFVLGCWTFPETIMTDKTPEKAISTLARQADVTPQTIIVAPHREMHAVAWSLHRSDVKVFGNPGELNYGVRAAKEKGETSAALNLNKLAALINTPSRPALCFFCAADNDDVERNYLLSGAETRELDGIKMLTFPAGARVLLKKGGAKR